MIFINVKAMCLYIKEQKEEEKLFWLLTDLTEILDYDETKE